MKYKKKYLAFQIQKGGFLEEWDYAYIDGIGNRHTHLLDIFCNAYLVAKFKRPAFLIEDRNYDDSCRERVLEFIKNLLKLPDGTPTHEFIRIPEGNLVVREKRFIRPEWYAAIQALARGYATKEGRVTKEDVTKLGKLLGYHCAGEMFGEDRVGLTMMIKGSEIFSQVCPERMADDAFRNMQQMQAVLQRMPGLPEATRLPEITIIRRPLPGDRELEEIRAREMRMEEKRAELDRNRHLWSV